MKAVSQGSVVTVSYTVSLDNGREFPPVAPEDTLELVVGDESVLPGFQNALLGMTLGQTKLVRIPCQDAYGPHVPEKLHRIERSRSVPNDLLVGDVVRVVSPEDGEFIAVVRDHDDAAILVDANHPLCGQDITFEIRLLGIRDPGERSLPALAASAAS